MFEAFQPVQGHHYRVLVLPYPAEEFTGCFHPDVGYFYPSTEEHHRFAMGSQDPEHEGKPLLYRLLPIIMWDLGKAEGRSLPRFTQDVLPHARAKAWILAPWEWDRLNRILKDWPADHHDLKVRCNDHRPWPNYDLSPTQGSVKAKVLNSTKPIAKTVADYIWKADKAWATGDFMALGYFVHKPLEELEAIFTIRDAERAEAERKWQEERAKTPAEELDAVFDNLLNDACPHHNVVAHKTFEDGSIDGKCADCGEEGFPIVGKSRLSRMRGPSRSIIRLKRLVSDLKTEPDLAVLIRQVLAEAER